MLEDFIPPTDQVYATSNLYPFIVAALYKSSAVSVIYQLLREVPSSTKRAYNHASHTKQFNCTALIIMRAIQNSMTRNESTAYFIFILIITQ